MADSEFQQTAEAFAAQAGIPVDPSQARRNELAKNLFNCVQQAAQARADLLSSSQGDSKMRGAVNYRVKEKEAQEALGALIEFEAGLL